MIKYYLFYLTNILALTTFLTAEKCDKLSITVDFKERDGTLQFSAESNFNVKNINESTNLILESSVIKNMSDNLPFKISGLCIYLDSNYYYCFSSSEIPIMIENTNISFQMYLNIYKVWNYQTIISEFIFDDNNLSMRNGSLFLKEQSIFTSMIPGKSNLEIYKQVKQTFFPGLQNLEF